MAFSKFVAAIAGAAVVSAGFTTSATPASAIFPAKECVTYAATPYKAYSSPNLVIMAKGHATCPLGPDEVNQLQVELQKLDYYGHFHTVARAVEPQSVSGNYISTSTSAKCSPGTYRTRTSVNVLSGGGVTNQHGVASASIKITC